jgi:hypothetical protein
MLEDVERVDALVEEQPVWTTLNGDAEEVVKRPVVFMANFRWSAEMVRRRSAVLDAVKMISST